MNSDRTRYSYRQGIYLLPNLLTTAALFFAFYVIVSAMKGQYESAAIALFLAMAADTLDGRIARLINAQSDFGAQYDSLSDMVASGLAPALMTYAWALHSLGKVGWLLAFIYTAATAMRLARFNIQLATSDKRFFQGLPCPTAAGVLGGIIWWAEQSGVAGLTLRYGLAVLIVVLAVLMVSNIRYYSFKDIDFKGRVPFIYILLIVMIFVGITLYPAMVLSIGFSLYALSGPVHTLIRLQQRRRARKHK